MKKTARAFIALFLIATLVVSGMQGMFPQIVNASGESNGNIGVTQWSDTQNGIFMISPDGDDYFQLSGNNEFAVYPTFSSDGTKSAYMNQEEENQLDIVVKSNPGGRITVVEQGVLPHMSPDGSKIAYLDLTDIENPVWNVINTDGTNKVTLNIPFLDFADYGIFDSSFFQMQQPQWTANSDYIIYPLVHESESGNIESTLHTISVDGNSLAQQLTEVNSILPALTNNYEDFYFVSSQIEMVEEIETLVIYLSRISMGGEVENLVELSSENGSPRQLTISPDNQKIAISYNKQPASETPRLDSLYTYNIDGTNEQAIVEDVPVWQDGLVAAWSPDSQKVAFSMGTTMGDDTFAALDLYTANHDGTGLTNVTNNNANDSTFVLTSTAWTSFEGDPSSEFQTLSFTDPLTGKPVLMEVSRTVSNATLESINPDSIRTDGLFRYPSSLASFQFNTAAGATETISFYYELPGSPDDYLVRKFNPDTEVFTTIEEAVVSRVTYDGRSVLKFSYQITDGGDLDLDATVNGTIVDPVGLALIPAGVPDTGFFKQ